MLLSDVFAKQTINLHLESKTKDGAFKELVEAIAEIHGEFDRDTMLAAVQDRENKMSTSIAPGVAIPHGYYPGTGSIFGALGVSESGIAYDAPDQKPVHCIFLVIMGEASRENHLRVLTRIMSLVNSSDLSLLRKAQSPEEIHNILSRIHG
jgi:mannitol/fructose-specific phosphotransferase system IIA component (Ntr-type)